MKKGEYIEQIQALKTEADSMLTLSEAYGKVNIDSLIFHRCGLIKNFVNNYHPDTITVEIAQNLEDLKFSCANLKAFEHNKNLVITVKKKSDELQNLLHLIQKGQGSRSEYQNFIAEERKSMVILKKNFKQLNINYLEGIKDYQVAENYIKSLLQP